MNLPSGGGGGDVATTTKENNSSMRLISCTKHKRNKKVTFMNKSREFIRFSKKQMSKTRDQGELQNNNNTHRWGLKVNTKVFFLFSFFPSSHVSTTHVTKPTTTSAFTLVWPENTLSTTISSPDTIFFYVMVVRVGLIGIR